VSPASPSSVDDTPAAVIPEPELSRDVSPSDNSSAADKEPVFEDADDPVQDIPAVSRCSCMEQNRKSESRRSI